MKRKKIQVYFVPGLAAGDEIFRNIELPTATYEIHILNWLIPEKNESLIAYAQRMAARITHEDAVLVGVSFGGVVVQEMSKFLKLSRLIIISSVKNKYELPLRIKFARKTFFYKLIPTSLVLSAEDLTKFAIGPKTEKRLKVYQEYLHVRDKQYLDWAIKQMVCWDRKYTLKKVVHIHGDKDVVFPIKNIENAVVLKGGTHIMILNKGKWISDKIVEIIEK
jgi:pimeloyl-ACP methyl ester carboxylesterase